MAHGMIRPVVIQKATWTYDGAYPAVYNVSSAAAAYMKWLIAGNLRDLYESRSV